MSKRSAQRNRWKNRPQKQRRPNLTFGGMDLGEVSRVFTSLSVDVEVLYKGLQEVFAVPVFRLGDIVCEINVTYAHILAELRKMEEENAFVYGNKPRYDGSDIRVIEPLQIEEVPDSVL